MPRRRELSRIHVGRALARLAPCSALDDRESRQLIEAVSNGFDLSEHVAGLVRASKGLPVQLLLATRSVLAAVRSGRTPLPESAPAEETRSSFEGPWHRLARGGPDLPDGRDLPPSGSDRPGTAPGHPDPATGMVEPAGTSGGRCVPGPLPGDGRRHPADAPAACSIRGGEGPGLRTPASRSCRRPLWAHLLSTADQVAQEPGNAGNALQLLAFDTSLESLDRGRANGCRRWRRSSPGCLCPQRPRAFRGREALGRACGGREAERATSTAASIRKALGTSLDLVGNCLAETGKYDEARPWFERAVAEKQKGDVHGRVDPGSVGKSLHQVGDCLAETSASTTRRAPGSSAPWRKSRRAMSTAAIDPESLGTSLHQVGDCLHADWQVRRGSLRGSSVPWLKSEKGNVERPHRFREPRARASTSWARAWPRPAGTARLAPGSSSP